MTDVLTITSWDDVPRSTEAAAVLFLVEGMLPGSPAAGLGRLAALETPVVVSLEGDGDAATLGLALAASYAVASDAFVADCSDVREVIAAGLGWRLVAATGGAAARALLLGPQPVGASRLAAAGIVTIDDTPRDAAGAVAARLAGDPAARLVIRSVRVAERSTAAQAAVYDRELLELLGE